MSTARTLPSSSMASPSDAESSSTTPIKNGYTNAELQGTYVALVPVSLPEFLVRLVKGAVTESDMNDDPLINKGRTFESHSHITVHLKIPSVPTREIKNRLAWMAPCQVRLTRASHFERRNVPFREDNRERNFDVVILDVEEEMREEEDTKEDHKVTSLLELHNRIGEWWGLENQHARFHPHVTCAYVKAGTGAAIAKRLNDELVQQRLLPVRIPVTELVFSKFQQRGEGMTVPLGDGIAHNTLQDHLSHSLRTIKCGRSLNRLHTLAPLQALVCGIFQTAKWLLCTCSGCKRKHKPS